MICAIKTAPAQTSQHQFSHLDITDGLSSNQINCIYKDVKGFMWFGTMAGLNRYDGYKFKIFKNNTHDTTSLSDNFIINIAEGPFNKLWIQTRNGLNIYDPLTERFDRNVKSALTALSIQGNSISNIKKDRYGNFWFLHPTRGVYKYNPNSKKTTHFEHKTGDTTSLYANNPTDIAENLTGDFLLIYPNGVIEKINQVTNKIDQRIYHINQLSRSEQSTFRIFADRQNDLWVFNVNNPRGIYYLNLKRNICKHINTNSAGSCLNTDVVTNIIQDDKNAIWIATDNGGINLLNKNDFTIQYLVKREDNNKSLAQNATISLFKDNTGIVWIGTIKEGISYYHEDIIKFPLYKHYSSDPSSIGYDDINKFAEDEKGNLWIGTNGKGLIYFNRKEGTFISYLHNASSANSLANNVIVSLCVDHEHKLWIGTYLGGLDCYNGKTFTHYRHNSAIPTSISDDNIWQIMEDSSHRLWVGTLRGGLNLLQPDKRSFKHYKQDSPASILNNYISGLVEDEHKNIWISTSYGVNVWLNKSRKFMYYLADPKNSNSLVNDNVTSLTEDSRHLFWIATRDGLSVFDKSKNQFTNLRKIDGLPDDAILDILEDDNHNMWVSTPNGLSNIIVTPHNGKLEFRFENYNETDGLQGRVFSGNASLKTKKGELIFGGPHGFNIFNPSSVKLNKSSPNLILTDFEVYNKTVNAGDTLNGHVILSKVISETKNITLNYDENAFAIEFTDLNLFNLGKTKFAYKLDGVDKDWVASDTRIRKATYTNIDAGNYVFRIRALDDAKGGRNTSDLTLYIKVLPPFWKSPVAYIIYGFSILGILYYIRKQGIKKIENRFEFERIKKEAQHMHELDRMKTDFFTNVSHEFRTPISLIMAPVEKLLRQSDDKNNQQKLRLIHQNANRLLNMINQLLDFSKIAVKKVQIDLHEADIIASVKEVCDLFIDVADKKHITFSFKSDKDSEFAFFDQDKIEKVLFNLLSNAIKFTPDYGNVAVEATLSASNNKETTLLEIKVKDSGIGMPAEKHDKIFERFFQNDMPASLINQGSGIGLSITKEFIDLMSGTVAVESEQGKGSCFIVRLPLKLSQKINVGETGHDPETDEIHQPESLPQEKRNKSITILIVEDNPDFRAYLKDDLMHLYTIAEAANGKEGWQKTLALHPDLIISDINMAESDGIDFCKKVRRDKRTEHIPFILITAFTGDEKQLVGLETGANDYLTKPFNFEILRFKVHNLLKNQQLAKETYQRQIEAKPGDLQIETPDVKFMKKLLAVIEKNMPDEGFSVEFLSGQMNMSRAALYNKVFNLSGKTPVEFIKSVRLERAVQLLRTDQFTIAEIAYQVGYSDAKYFSKVFKTEFLVTPSQYLDHLD
jgi:signal transduction histidine kinase/ligand-binding sensor domain-containing protein/CheY-like chemotaxis protein/AraC-like DNA-binding protein